MMLLGRQQERRQARQRRACRRWTSGLIVGLGIVAGVCACGEAPGRDWIVGWNTSWTGPSSDKPVSKDGRFAYFVTEKCIVSTEGRWDRSWRSVPFRGRVDLVTGNVDTGLAPEGMNLFGGYRGYVISDAVNGAIWGDSVIGASEGERETRIHGYGDGRFLLFIRRPNFAPSQLYTFLLDNEDTYRIIGTGFRDGWISTDEKTVILVKQGSEDTWLYNIGSRRLSPVLLGDTIPHFFRGLQDLTAEKQRLAAEAMGRHCARRRYSIFYPEHEELK